jgi:hypothetical protein
LALESGFRILVGRRVAARFINIVAALVVPAAGDAGIAAAAAAAAAAFAVQHSQQITAVVPVPVVAATGAASASASSEAVVEHHGPPVELPELPVIGRLQEAEAEQKDGTGPPQQTADGEGPREVPGVLVVVAVAVVTGRGGGSVVTVSVDDGDDGTAVVDADVVGVAGPGRL